MTEANETNEKPTGLAIVELEQIKKEKALTTFSDAFSSVAAFAHAERVASVFAGSALVPEHFRGKPADCLVAYELARTLDVHPLLLMQGIYTVHGRVGWGSSFLINLVNSRSQMKSAMMWYVRKLDPPTLKAHYYENRERVDYQMVNLGVTAYAVAASATDPEGLKKELRAMGEADPAAAVKLLQQLGNAAQLAVSPEITSEMAIADGWASGRSANKKYHTLPELMLRYRAAGIFTRLHCPEVLMGFKTLEEVETMPEPAPRPVLDVSSVATETRPPVAGQTILGNKAMHMLSIDIEESGWSAKRVCEALGIKHPGPITEEQERQIRELIECEPPDSPPAQPPKRRSKASTPKGKGKPQPEEDRPADGKPRAEAPKKQPEPEADEPSTLTKLEVLVREGLPGGRLTVALREADLIGGGQAWDQIAPDTPWEDVQIAIDGMKR